MMTAYLKEEKKTLISKQLLSRSRTVILVLFGNIFHRAQAAHPLGGLAVFIVGT